MSSKLACDITATSESAIMSANGDVDHEKTTLSGGICVKVTPNAPADTRRTRGRNSGAESCDGRLNPPEFENPVVGEGAVKATSTVSAYIAFTKEESNINVCKAFTT